MNDLKCKCERTMMEIHATPLAQQVLCSDALQQHTASISNHVAICALLQKIITIIVTVLLTKLSEV